MPPQPSVAEKLEWVNRGARRKKILLSLKQPMTVKQISWQAGLPMMTCSYVLWELEVGECVMCLNDDASSSRLFWLTDLGKTCQKKVREERSLKPFRHELAPRSFSR